MSPGRYVSRSLRGNAISTFQGCLLFKHAQKAWTSEEWKKSTENCPPISQRTQKSSWTFVLRSEEWVGISGFGQQEASTQRCSARHRTKHSVFKEVGAWQQHAELDESGKGDRDGQCRALSAHIKDVVPYIKSSGKPKMCLKPRNANEICTSAKPLSTL